MLIDYDPLAAQRPQYLNCRDKHPRCSIAACSVDDQVACGSMYGGIQVWDSRSGKAKHFVQDGVCPSSPAIPWNNSNTILSMCNTDSDAI
jgi:hypothetical protein